MIDYLFEVLFTWLFFDWVLELVKYGAKELKDWRDGTGKDPLDGAMMCVVVASLIIAIWIDQYQRGL